MNSVLRNSVGMPRHSTRSEACPTVLQSTYCWFDTGLFLDLECPLLCRPSVAR